MSEKPTFFPWEILNLFLYWNLARAPADRKVNKGSELSKGLWQCLLYFFYPPHRLAFQPSGFQEILMHQKMGVILAISCWCQFGHKWELCKGCFKLVWFSDHDLDAEKTYSGHSFPLNLSFSLCLFACLFEALSFPSLLEDTVIAQAEFHI